MHSVSILDPNVAKEMYLVALEEQSDRLR
jgi:hypothetical protein